MKNRGRKRPPDAEFLLKQVAEVFKEKRDKLGVERAAKELGVSRASFYKYLGRENVPDMGVLLAAKEKWGIKWQYLDPSEVLRPLKVKTAEQLVFSFLSEMGEEDIEVVEVGPEGTNVLRVSLKIRIPAKH